MKLLVLKFECLNWSIHTVLLLQIEWTDVVICLTLQGLKGGIITSADIRQIYDFVLVTKYVKEMPVLTKKTTTLHYYLTMQIFFTAVLWHQIARWTFNSFND